jgi:hypothetical protein
MSSNTPEDLISVRQGAERFGIREESIYRAKRRGTITVAKGQDVPEGVWFKESEFERWAANRKHLQRQGRPKGSTP